MPTKRLDDLAKLAGARLIGDGGLEVQQALPLQDASVACVTLVDKPSQIEKLRSSAAVAVVCSQPLEGCDLPMLVAEDIHSAFIEVIKALRPASSRTLQGIAPTANIDLTAEIGADVSIGPGAVIGPGCRVGDGTTIHAGVHLIADCTVGADCEIHSGSVLYPDTQLGDRVLLHAGVVLGSYGFGYKQVDGKHVRTAQLGWVEVHDDVEIGAASTIDRGTYGATKIGEGSKLDNQVQIGHNCHIGKHNLICSQVGIAGSSSTGDYVTLAGQVGIADHVHMADKSIAGAQSGIMQDTKPGEIVFGYPAGPVKRKMQEVALVGKLGDLRKDVRELKKTVATIQNSDRQSARDAA